MKTNLGPSLLLVIGIFFNSCAGPSEVAEEKLPSEPEVSPQTPTWTKQDMDFFLHGSMSTEFVPEVVLRSFIRVYPDLFPTQDLSHLGLLPDTDFGWPVGFSRSQPAHLASLSSVGVNCASCHVGEVQASKNNSRIRLLGVTSHFDAEAFFNEVIGATFLTSDPANMKKFLAEYLEQNDPESDSAKRAQRQKQFTALWESQEPQIVAAMKSDPGGANGAGDGGLQKIDEENLQLNSQLLSKSVDLAQLSISMLKLFHNMRAALHIPDQLPEKLPPPAGPGRNDAFGLLSAVLFGAPQPPSPVKYGLVWNLQNRHWVHWDGNTQSPIGRNLLASVGLGAPLIGNRAQLNFQLVQHHTDLSQRIIAPPYPFAINQDAARRGYKLYQNSCASCHNTETEDQRLYAIEEIGTDPNRAQFFTPLQAGRFNQFLAQLHTPGYKPSAELGIRSTQKYWSPNLAGVWARSPYLHNGSVRTMEQLLTSPQSRDASFHRGSRVYDEKQMGYTNEGSYLLDTKVAGNLNTGHDYGTQLSIEEKHDLIEYLKTL